MENPFRPKYRELKHTETALIKEIKDDAWVLLQKFPKGTSNAALAAYKLEEAVMWAVKDITA